jgi:50S ribosome-binding GTPase
MFSQPSNPEKTPAPWRVPLNDALSLLPALLGTHLPTEPARRAETLLTLCHVLAFRFRHAGAPPLVGIVGSASCGKSLLFNSIAGLDLAAVTPTPHRTTGAIVYAPELSSEARTDPSLLRPIVESIDSAPADARELVGSPTRAMLATASAPSLGCALLDLPDIGTVESDEENHVALRTVPWLDRVVLLLTEESFAQAEHETIRDLLALLVPERARPELFVVLNRRHEKTTDAEFEARLTGVKQFWPEALVSTLPHLPAGAPRFAPADVSNLVAEAAPRLTRMLGQALRNLASEVATDTAELARARRNDHERISRRLATDLHVAARFRKSFFSNDFRRRLESFSPWRTSIEKLRSLVSGTPQTSLSADLLDPEPVTRHAAVTLRDIRDRLERDRAAAFADSAPLPQLDEPTLATRVAELVSETNRDAKEDVDTLLTALQENRRVKDPVWSGVAAVASTMFVLDLFLPGVGTATSLSVLGGLSALGLGGVVTADVLRGLRTSRVRDTFERRLKQILADSAEPFALAAAPSAADLADLAQGVSAWRRSLPEDG